MTTNRMAMLDLCGWMKTRAKYHRLRGDDVGGLALVDAAKCEAASDAIRALIEERDALREALEMIAGRRQCIDNLMSHKEIALAALELKP